MVMMKMPKFGFKLSEFCCGCIRPNKSAKKAEPKTQLPINHFHHICHHSALCNHATTPSQTETPESITPIPGDTSEYFKALQANLRKLDDSIDRSSPTVMNKSTQTDFSVVDEKRISKTISLLSFEDIEKQILTEHKDELVVSKNKQPAKTAEKVRIPKNVAEKSCKCNSSPNTPMNAYIRSHYANRLARKIEQQQALIHTCG